MFLLHLIAVASLVVLMVSLLGLWYGSVCTVFWWCLCVIRFVWCLLFCFVYCLVYTFGLGVLVLWLVCVGARGWFGGL